MDKSQRLLLNVEDYHQQAKSKLPAMIYDFYSTGSDDQLTLIDNERAFRQIKLRPKVLIDVSSHSAKDSINCQTQVLKSTVTLSFPCMIAPTALHRLANNEHGELATVRAAVACSTIMCVSTNASVNMKRIADEQKSTPSVITREQTVTSASPDPSSSGTSPLQSSPPPAVIERRTEEDQTRQNLLPSSSPATPPTTTITVGPSKNYYRQILIIM